jgi:hypothetical protein
VLRSTNAGFGVRSIVVEATAIGAPMPALKDDLIEVVLRTQSPYAERLYALIALLRIGPEGEAAAGSAFHKLGTDVNALRLRAEMIHRMYGEPFGPADITTKACISHEPSQRTGSFALHRSPADPGLARDYRY